MSQRYPTELTETEWTVLTSLIPAAKPGGRPRTTDMREVVHAIFYLLRGGCQWRMLPKEFPPHQTVYHYFRTWRRGGVWERIHDTLRGDLREALGRTREPSAGIIDSQTVKTTEKRGSGAMTAASASVGASATSSSMSSVCSSSSWCILRGSRIAMGPNRCSGHSWPAFRDCSSFGLTGGMRASSWRGWRPCCSELW
jgi:putative transposase